MWIKICGITNEEDALLAVALGSYALGFVFAPGSPRQVTPQIVGEILVNSRGNRVVESTLKIAPDQDVAEAIRVVREALTRVPQVVREPAPEVGVQTFSAADVTIGLRYWAPARAFFPTQFAVNLEARAALAAAGLKFA